ncbi:MAG: AMP-binding protein [Kiritimatiellaeota bacterium]|nr:AMP-binding protein [Kiritimatiellota bacterium]
MITSLLNRTDFDSYDDFVANYAFNIPEKFNFGFDIVDAITAKDSGRRAIVWCNDAGAERTFTMADVTRLSNQAANYFASLGVRKGDFVMLILKRRWQYWPAVVGLHKLGAVAIPATTLLTKKDIVYRCKAAGVKMIVSVNEPGIRGAIEAAEDEVEIPLKALVEHKDGAGWLDFDAGMAAAPGAFPRPADAACGKEDMMLLYFTSGTTGMPKMATHNHLYPLGHIATARYWQRCMPGGLHFTIAETGWAKTAWGKLYGQWIAGSAVMVYDFNQFVAGNILRVIAKHGVTTFCAPPTMYRFMLQEDVSAYDLSTITHYSTAGEPLNPEVYNQWSARTGHGILEGFGQSESSVLCANFEWFDPKPGSMGKPSPLYDIAIVDERLRPCEEGVEGHLVVRGLDSGATPPPPGLFKFYYKDAALTDKVWREGVYDTGDIAWMDTDGHYWFVGRDDDIIKCSGYRIGPFEVESALLEHNAVVECAVTAAPDPIRGQVVKATVVLANGHAPSDELVKELQRHVKKVTAPYKYPRIVEFVDELPKTIGGKIKRGQIRDADKA